MGNGCTVVVEAFACEFCVDFIQAAGLGEPVFFPQFLDYASAGFGSWKWCGTFRDLAEVGVF